MADVQIQQEPPRGGATWVWAVVVVILVAVIAWFVFMRGEPRPMNGDRIDVEITTPALPDPTPPPAPQPTEPPPATP